MPDLDQGDAKTSLAQCGCLGCTDHAATNHDDIKIKRHGYAPIKASMSAMVLGASAVSTRGS
ncbi:hypothetical protein, partial [Pseudomonas sp.]|uniref:hypothetical protein n=1 Tax=Pseudomonas sp. TaxID=306 RepID=UPI0035698924